MKKLPLLLAFTLAFASAFAQITVSTLSSNVIC